MRGGSSATPRIERVWYPGLPSHPDHAVARAQMTGFGGVVNHRGAARARIRDNLVRLALGIEDAADIIADLEQALAG